MHIVIVSPEFPPYTNWGGVATFNYNLAKLLQGGGHEVEIITHDGKGDIFHSAKVEGFLVHYIQYKTDSRGLRKLLGLAKKIIPDVISILEWNIFAFVAFRHINRRKKVDIVHTQSYWCSGALIKLCYPHVPSVVHIQGPQEYLNPYDIPSLDNRIHAFFEKYTALYLSNTLIFCSQSLKEKFLNNFPNMQKKSFVIPNFIDVSQFKNSSTINKNTIVFMGRLEYRKGVDLLVRTFVSLAKQYPHVQLYLIGKESNNFPSPDGLVSFFTWMKNESIQRDIRRRIHAIARIDDRKQLLDFLRAHTGVGVFPSRYEPFGFVYIEAMALGFAVVGTKNYGFEEIARVTRNDSVAEFTVKSLIASIKTILDQPKKITARKVAIHRKAVNNYYSIKSVRKMYASVYNYLGCAIIL